MRALAEFAMKDRRSAIIAVLLLGLVPMLNLLSPVLVGLIMLRKGWNEALAILVWALLPIGAYAYIGDVVPLVLLLGVTLLAAALIPSTSACVRTSSCLQNSETAHAGRAESGVSLIPIRLATYSACCVSTRQISESCAQLKQVSISSLLRRCASLRIF